MSYALVLFTGLAAVLAFFFIKSATRLGYESAPYRVLRQVGRFEIREYPELLVVRTPMETKGTESYASFNRLFRFISGANVSKQKIAMTTPVFISEPSAPSRTMSFVLPQKWTQTQVPQPSDAQVQVQRLAAGRFAVLRFSGDRSSANEDQSWRKLSDWLRQEGLSANSAPIFAYFDPPWMPSLWKRNEVMVGIKAG